MSRVRDGNFSARKTNERGGARFNLLIVVVVLVAAAYAGYQYVPVAYQASQLKIFMEDTANKAVITDKNAQWVEEQLRKSLPEYGAPPDTLITVVNRESRLEANMQYTIPIPLIVTTYQYKFNYTTRSSNFFSK
ncbi:MAG: hypothetical protein LC747_02540 [Acidobacteria bacterium]|nr:hypothetical protein [Acidobacteriota bacterium]